MVGNVKVWPILATSSLDSHHGGWRVQIYLCCLSGVEQRWKGRWFPPCNVEEPLGSYAHYSGNSLQLKRKQDKHQTWKSPSWPSLPVKTGSVLRATLWQRLVGVQVILGSAQRWTEQSEISKISLTKQVPKEPSIGVTGVGCLLPAAEAHEHGG